MKKVLIGFLVIVVSLLLATTSVQAKATETPYTGVESTDSFGVPERAWMADGVLHVRGLPVENTFEGTFAEGAFSFSNDVVFNLNLDPATGDGDAFGSFALDGTWGDLQGSFEGRWTMEITTGAVLLAYVGQGSGDFEGMKIMGKGTGSLPIETMIITHEGIVLAPHG